MSKWQLVKHRELDQYAVGFGDEERVAVVYGYQDKEDAEKLFRRV